MSYATATFVEAVHTMVSEYTGRVGPRAVLAIGKDPSEGE